MSRKDVIIVAVLVNAGVLAILFMLAFNSDEKEKPSVANNKEIELPQVGDMKVIEPNDSPEFIVIPSDSSEETPLKEVQIASSQTSDDFEELLNDPDLEEKPAQMVESKPEIKPAPLPIDTKYVQVTVKKGDSLDKIAKINGTTIKTLKDVNNLKSDRLSIGQVLKVPVGKKDKEPAVVKKPAQQPTSTHIASSTEPEWYTVKSGDNPWKIAKQFHIKVDDLLKLNNLNEEKAKNMKIGDKIRIK